MKLLRTCSTLLLGSALLYACNGNNGTSEPLPTADTATAQPIKTPSFNADTAYALVAAQVAFGPRTPGSAAQKNAPTGCNKSCSKSVILSTGKT